jgi:hypothetical protein
MHRAIQAVAAMAVSVLMPEHGVEHQKTTFHRRARLALERTVRFPLARRAAQRARRECLRVGRGHVVRHVAAVRVQRCGKVSAHARGVGLQRAAHVAVDGQRGAPVLNTR